jgi:hypothetical protein
MPTRVRTYHPVSENPYKQQIPEWEWPVLRGYCGGKIFHRGGQRTSRGKQTYLSSRNTQTDRHNIYATQLYGYVYVYAYVWLKWVVKKYKLSHLLYILIIIKLYIYFYTFLHL